VHLMTRMIMLTTGPGEPCLQDTSRPGPDAAARSGGPGGTAAGQPEGWADPGIIVSAALAPPPSRGRRRCTGRAC
jgi:hypothetical protein